MGYTGGTKADPTYRELGDHTESIQIDFDPNVVTYEDLLEVFWTAHNPTGPRRSSQYKTAIFFHDPEQQRLAVETAARIEEKLGHPLTTEILSASRFYRAEDYHQKFRLRRHAGWMNAIQATHSDPDQFTDSTSAARLNGFLAGHGSGETLHAALERIGRAEGIL